MTTRRKMLLSSALSTVVLTTAVTGAAYAQTASGPSEVQEVIVTGSRLPTGYTAPTPLSIVSSDALLKKAPTQVLDALYDIPAFRTDSGPSQGQRAAASLNVATANLRGLGANRTLTLVDGVRQVGLANQTFDTNRIPTGLVDRVEVVTGGASAAYGSDAVAGVVNFVINSKLEGMRGSVQYGISQQNDNRQYTLTFAAGKSFGDGRGHIVFGSDYSDSEGTGTIYSRSWGRKEPGLVSPSAAQRAALGLPANVYTNGVEFYGMGTPGGIITSGPLVNTAYKPDGTPYAFAAGTGIGAAGTGLAIPSLMIGSTANYGQTTLGTFYLSQPLKRSSSMARVTFDITPDLTAFADMSYTYSHSEGVAGVQSLPNQIMSTFSILSTNPYIPAATRTAMTQAGISEFKLGYAPVSGNPNGDNSGYVSKNDGYTLQTNIGLRGHVFDKWKWDFTWAHGWFRADPNFLNTLYTPNFAAATYVVNGPNGPECGPIATNPNLTAATRALVLPGCVPYNPFGLNAASKAAINYVTVQTHALTVNREDTFQANISGELINLWAGPLSVAAGLERRRDDLKNTGEGYNSNAIAFSGTSSYAGHRNVTEGYLEVGLPLMRDQVLAKSMDLNAAVRRTDYELTGAVTTAKIGGTWDLNDWLRFRATGSRDIRAPNLQELFNTGVQGAGGANVRNPFNGVTGSLLTRPGGNPALQPEVAQTFTGGMVLRPKWEWASRFTFTADYYWIKLKSVISSVSGTDTLNRCFNGIQAYCANITFDSSPFGIAYITTTTYNLNQLRTKGVDLEIAYHAPIEAVGIPGDLRVRAVGNYQPRLVTIDSTGVAVDRAGTAQGNNEWRWIVNFDYTLGKFSGQLQANYFNSILSDPTLIGPDDSRYASIMTTASNTVNKNRFPSEVYLNLSAQYKLNDRVEFYGNINNLLDKDPPDLSMIGLSSLNGGFTPYDLIGRMYRIGARFTY